jgi:hypothetical protein
MFWFRVELDAKGNALSCTQLAKAPVGEAGGLYFFRATTAKSATQLAFREYHRLRQVSRRARYAAEGKCRCGRSRKDETPEERKRSVCAACLKLARVDHERQSLKAKGLLAPPVDKAALFRDRRTEEKLELLKEVSDKFMQSSMRTFGLWLQEEIEKLQPKEAPKLRVVGGKG